MRGRWSGGGICTGHVGTGREGTAATIATAVVKKRGLTRVDDEVDNPKAGTNRIGDLDQAVPALQAPPRAPGSKGSTTPPLVSGHPPHRC